MNISRRKRVEIALDHREPDRVPCDITIEPNVYAELCNRLGEKFDPYWWDDWNHAYPSVEVLEKLHVDVMHLKLNDVPSGYTTTADEFVDQWGITKKKIMGENGTFMYNLVGHPLKDAESVDDILSYNWPSPEEVIDITNLRKETEYLYNNTDFALTATFGGNVFERPHYLRGMDNFFVDLMTNPDIACALMDKVLEIVMEVDRMVLAEIGEFITYTRFRGEDLGTQNNLIISPQIFHDIVKPRLQKEWQTAKKLFTSKNPKGKISVHSCGAIFDLIPAFIEMGADILNPVQPNAQGMDTALISKTFGNKLSFHGSIDTQGVLNNGSVDDVIAETKTRLRDLGPGGGFIIAPAHNIQHGVSVDKIIAMYETIHKFGKYPINIP